MYWQITCVGREVCHHRRLLVNDVLAELADGGGGGDHVADGGRGVPLVRLRVAHHRVDVPRDRVRVRHRVIVHSFSFIHFVE